MDEKTNTNTDDFYCEVLYNLNKRLKSIEEKVPNYTADMLEVYRNFGALTKQISELENKVEKLVNSERGSN